MISIAMYNLAAGVGTTTLVVNLAWYLYKQHGRRVLLVDLDPQFHASKALMSVERYDDHRTKFGTATDLMVNAPNPNRSSKIMYPVEISTDKKSFLLTLPAEPELFRVIRSPGEATSNFRRQLRAWEGNFDFIFFDCAPDQTALTAVAMMAADCVAIPMRPDRFSVLSYPMTLEVLEGAKHAARGKRVAHNIGVIYTRVPKKGQELVSACKDYVKGQSPFVFKSEIPESKITPLKAPQGAFAGLDSQFCNEIPSAPLSALAVEMDARIRALWPVIKGT